MKGSRFFSFWTVVFLTCAAFSGISAETKNAAENFSAHAKCSFSSDAHSGRLPVSKVVSRNSIDGGVREEIADKYREKYARWKNEFLSTEFGRAEWKNFAENKDFALIIKIRSDEGQGAGTSDYLWDETGNLVGATIILGSKIDRGYPNPIYFPVVNSLSVRKPTYRISENILAAAKFAHEFGHVKQTAKTGGVTFRRQNELISEYNEIFRAGNFDAHNARLAVVQENLGGTPVEIWENREYWGETNAMSFVIERIGKENIYCAVVGKIENNVKNFAANYEDRFTQIFQTADACRD